MALVRAKTTGVTREVSREDADALLAWRDDSGSAVWEEITKTGRPKKKTGARRGRKAKAPVEETAPAGEE